MRSSGSWRSRNARLNSIDAMLLPMQNADFSDSGERFLASQLAVAPRKHIEMDIIGFMYGDVDVVFKGLLLIVGLPG